MLQPGKMQEVANEMTKNNIDLIALQEMRWQGQGRLDKPTFSVIFSGTEQRTGQLGTGFMMSKKVRNALLEYETVNERICKIRIKGAFRNITAISVHAPTEEKDEHTKEDFYDKLDEICCKVNKYDTLIILGDYNAKVGNRETDSQVVGKYSLHEENNNNGELLVQFATRNNMCIRSTTFQHRDIHLGTWKIPGTNNTNQIDHVLVNQRYYTSVIDVRSCRGPNVDSDHYLVKAVLRNRITNAPRTTRSNTKKWDTPIMKKDPEKVKEYQQTIERRLEDIIKEDCNVETIDEEWDKIEKAITEAANETIGERQRKRNEEWFDQQCEQAIRKKNEARKQMLQINTRRNKERYKALRREANNVCKQKKKEALNRKLKEVDELNKDSEDRKFYEAVKRIKRKFQPKMEECKGKDGTLIADEIKRMERWREHFKELLTDENGTPIGNEIEETTRGINTNIQEEEEAPTIADVRVAIAKMKNHKAPGEDSIIPELLKYGGEKLNEAIFNIITAIWTQEKMPEKWNTGIICPIYKKGDKKECSNYRGITLLNTAYKVLSFIINNKLKETTDSKIGEYQCGFRPNRGTTDQLFVMRQLMEKCYEYNTDLYMLFVDYKQAFDSIKRDKLRHALKDIGVSQKLTNIIMMTIAQTKARVKVDNKLTEPFEFDLGVKQGDGLSATLFIIAINYAIKDLDQRGTIFNKSTQICGYADDIVLITRTKKHLETLFNQLEEKAEELGLIVNENKSKYMVMSADENRRKPKDLEIGQRKFEGVAQFKYLGDTLDHQVRIDIAIKERITSGNKAYFANLNLLKSKIINRKTKIKIYKTLIRPVVTYGGETWTLKQEDQEKLRRFERKIIRRIYGPVFENDEWRILYNNEINNILHDEDIVRFIKSQRLRWFGHVQRMDDTKMQKRVLKGKIYGTRKRGAPKLRWLDDVTKDLRTMNVQGWCNLVKNRIDWRHIVEEAKAHKGL
uniref:Craniofacial development protein 2 n=1 Tax=Cacopsylla melanoneura TaxID=428564 RepID=A0A8D8YS40_9HEMI